MGYRKFLKPTMDPLFKVMHFSHLQKRRISHQKITPLWPEANGHVEGFRKNLGKVARTAHSQGKDWRRELHVYVFLTNYRATPHPSTGKSPYQLCLNRTVGIKHPTIMETTPDMGAMQKDEDSSADQKRHVKLHNLNARRHHTGETEKA